MYDMCVEEILTGIYAVWSYGWQTVEVKPFHIAHGHAKGADYLADSWAMNSPLHGPCFEAGNEPSVEEMWKMHAPPVILHRYPADWSGPCDPSFCKPGHRRATSLELRQAGYCPAAGPRRNRRMFADFEPTHVEAFVDKPLIESRGTLDMVTIARAAGVEPTVHLHGRVS